MTSARSDLGRGAPRIDAGRGSALPTAARLCPRPVPLRGLIIRQPPRWPTSLRPEVDAGSREPLRAFGRDPRGSERRGQRAYPRGRRSRWRCGGAWCCISSTGQPPAQRRRQPPYVALGPASDDKGAAAGWAPSAALVLRAQTHLRHRPPRTGLISVGCKAHSGSRHYTT